MPTLTTRTATFSSAFALCILFFAAPAAAIDVPETAKATAAEDHVELRLILNADKTKAAVLFDIIPDWHIYWFNSGDSGMATRTKISDVPAQMLTPRVYVDPSKTLSTFGFETQTIAYVDVPKNVETIDAAVSFLVCKVECIPGNAKLSRSRSTAVSPEEASVFESLLASAPRTVDALVSVANGNVTLSFDSEIQSNVERNPDSPYVFIPAVSSPPWKTESTSSSGTTHSLVLSGGDECSVEGVVPLVENGQRRGYVISTSFDCDAEAARVEDRPEDESIWWILLLAFVGGLILNLMPCVFPVLAIKVAALADHAGDKNKSLFTFAYVAGILVSMWALAAIVLLLKSAGTLVGWGFQFQQPIFVALMFVILLAFAANLLGAFEFIVGARVDSRSSGLGKSFSEGILSVVLATPCSAPILGTAVGFAFAGSTVEIVSVFSLIGLGLATPFVILVFLPFTTKILPSPGPWMQRLKQVLSIALFATAVWIGWLVYGAGGMTFLAATVAWGVAVVSALLWYGKTQFEKPKRVWAPILVLIVGLGLVSALPNNRVNAVVADGWEPWSGARVEALKKEGRIVFVDFTADWCITCKVNENGVLVSDAVTGAFKKYDVVKLKADWTHPDDAIAKTLSKYGRAGVPMYLVIGTDTAVLPELLTDEIVVNAIETAAKNKTEKP